MAAGALAVAVVPATAASAASPKPIKTTGRAGPRVVDTVDPCTRGNTPISSLTEGQADALCNCLINQARAANGVPPLPYAMAGILMAKSARAHALLSVNQRFWTTWQSSHMEPGAAGDDKPADHQSHPCHRLLPRRSGLTVQRLPRSATCSPRR